MLLSLFHSVPVFLLVFPFSCLFLSFSFPYLYLWISLHADPHTETTCEPHLLRSDDRRGHLNSISLCSTSSVNNLPHITKHLDVKSKETLLPAFIPIKYLYTFIIYLYEIFLPMRTFFMVCHGTVSEALEPCYTLVFDSLKLWRETGNRPRFPLHFYLVIIPLL